MNSNVRKMLIAATVILAAVVVWNMFEYGTGPKEDSKPSSGGATVESPAPGEVVMVDLGADECTPCKLMAPILEELKEAYAGRAKIIFIDVWKNQEEAKKYGIQAIPTQVFFNAQGEEVARHTGFMDKESIVQKLTELGVDPPKRYEDL
ncbi:MAG: thioredoxin family protein [Desulfonatronovibrionaceae bacterium]